MASIRIRGNACQMYARSYMYGPLASVDQSINQPFSYKVITVADAGFICCKGYNPPDAQFFNMHHAILGSVHRVHFHMLLG
jgi:hypothetical protein